MTETVRIETLTSAAFDHAKRIGKLEKGMMIITIAGIFMALTIWKMTADI